MNLNILNLKRIKTPGRQGLCFGSLMFSRGHKSRSMLKAFRKHLLAAGQMDRWMEKYKLKQNQKKHNFSPIKMTTINEAVTFNAGKGKIMSLLKTHPIFN